MVLKKLRLHPFAGFREKEIQFTPGLNVLVGPNDVGKSSLFRAIDAALFLPTKLRANTVEGKSLKRIIPFGGDFASVSLQFEQGGNSFELEKTWGHNAGEKLLCPDGTRLSSLEKIAERLNEVFPAPSATFQNILFVSQNSLEATLETLKKNQESLHSLGDLLRLALNETGGVSIDRLKSILEEKLEEMYLNWDIETDGPRKSRGIENEWDRQGKILALFYEAERTKKKLADTRALESELGDRLSQLGEKQKRYDESREFVRRNQKVVEAVSVRQTLGAKLDKIEQEAAAIQKDFSAWVQAESDRKVMTPEVSRMQEQMRKFELELKESRAEALRKSLLSRFEKVRAAKANYEEQKQKLSALIPIRAEELKKIRFHSQNMERLKASLSAGKLQVQFIAKSDLEISVKKDLEAERKGVLKSGAPMTIRAGGKVRIESGTFELTVVSGEGKIEEVESQLKIEGESMQKLLQEKGVQSFEEAQEKSEAWVASSNALKSCESAYLALLGGEKFEELERAFEQARNAKEGRDPEVVQKEFSLLMTELGAKNAQLQASQKMIAELQKRYQVEEPSQLTKLMVSREVEKESLKMQLSALPSSPKESSEENQLLSKFREAQSSIAPLAEEIRALSNIVVEIKAKMPDMSSQDIDRTLRDVKAALEREMRRGRALLNVQAAIEKIESKAGDVYEGFRAQFEEYVTKLSSGKYHRTQMQGSLPSEFLRSDGAAIPFEWLSAGTKDAFCLALRLAMAKHFLGKTGGFLLLDDPMVAMDPERQRAVAALLQEMAQESQVIVFSCHPAHAELLGGNRLLVS